MGSREDGRIATYLDPDVYVALRRRAMVTGEPLQGLVREAVEDARAADIDDRASFNARAEDPVRSFEEFHAERSHAEDV